MRAKRSFVARSFPSYSVAQLPTQPVPECMVRIGITQSLEYWQDPKGALLHVNEVSARADAAGAELLIFPEGFLQGYLLDKQDVYNWALDVASGEFTDLLSCFPASGPMIVLGMIEKEAGHYFNTAVVVKDRCLIGRYRKKHLLSSEHVFSRGCESPIFEVSGLRFGICICYDANFSTIARDIADAGARMMICCANNMLPRDVAETYREVHNIVRAERCREVDLWMVSSDVTGARDGKVSWGPSSVISPAGDVVAQLPLDQPGFLTFDIPKS